MRKKVLSLLTLALMLPVLLLLGVTPTYASISFMGLRSRKTYTKDVYIADVANAQVHWDAGQGASGTTPTEWICPEPVLLGDIAVVSGPTVIFKLQITRNGVPTGDIIRLVPHLTTNPMRPRLQVGFETYARIAAIELV